LERAGGSVKACSSDSYDDEVTAIEGKLNDLTLGIEAFSGTKSDSAVPKFRAQMIPMMMMMTLRNKRKILKEFPNS
jgi:hypothetical protein